MSPLSYSCIHHNLSSHCWTLLCSPGHEGKDCKWSLNLQWWRFKPGLPSTFHHPVSHKYTSTKALRTSALGPKRLSSAVTSSNSARAAVQTFSTFSFPLSPCVVLCSPHNTSHLRSGHCLVRTLALLMQVVTTASAQAGCWRTWQTSGWAAEGHWSMHQNQNNHMTTSPSSYPINSKQTKNSKTLELFFMVGSPIE